MSHSLGDPVPEETNDRSPASLQLERRRARERLRWVKPATCGKVLAHERYWTVQFLQRYLERCDDLALDMPADAYLLGQHVPEIARRIRVGDHATEFETAQQKLSGIVTALAVKASCCYVHHEMQEAVLSIRRAFGGLAGRQASPAAMADLHGRHAVLLTLQRFRTEALASVETCLEFAEPADERAIAADALALRGHLRRDTEPAEALLDALRAVRYAERKTKRGERTAEAAFFSALAIVGRPGLVSLHAQEQALKLLVRARKELNGTPTSARKLRLQWLEGRILSNLKIGRHAARQLGKASHGLQKLRLPADFALASLDLIGLHVSEGDLDDAARVAHDLQSPLERLGLGDHGRTLVQPGCVGHPSSDTEMSDLRHALLARFARPVWDPHTAPAVSQDAIPSRP